MGLDAGVDHQRAAAAPVFLVRERLDGSLQHYVDCLGSDYEEGTVFPTVFEGSSEDDTLVTGSLSADIANKWPGTVVYEAISGHNHGPLLSVDGEPFPPGNDDDIGYTPWPSAIRITLTLHDPGQRLEHGRTFQFVIALPKRG